MNKNINEIDKLIQEDVQNRTFSLEAIEAIKTMRDEVDTKDETIKSLNTTVKHLNSQLDKKDKEIYMNNSSIKGLTDKVAGFDKREKEHAKLDKDLAVAEATKTLAVDMAMGLVRNTTYKKTMFGNGPTDAPTTDQYGNQQHGCSSVNEETTVTEE